MDARVGVAEFDDPTDIEAVADTAADAVCVVDADCDGDVVTTGDKVFDPRNDEVRDADGTTRVIDAGNERAGENVCDGVPRLENVALGEAGVVADIETELDALRVFVGDCVLEIVVDGDKLIEKVLEGVTTLLPELVGVCEFVAVFEGV